MGAPRHDGGWTDERTAELKKLWIAGNSAATCARILGGGVTRNACIGKVKRMGLSNRPKAAAPQKAAAVPRAPSVPRKQMGISAATRLAAAQGAPAPVLAPPQDLRPDPKIAREPLRVDMLALGAHQCRWPLVKVPPFTFCGLQTEGGGSYCREHERIARPGPAPGRRPVGEKELIRSVRRFI